jgi:5-methylcytosine-specific restriction endonuclease McrA
VTVTADRRSRSSANVRGNTTDRRRRREYLMTTYRADVDLSPNRDRTVPLGQGVPCVRCYRCGDLMAEDELTVDRIVPGHKGGRYVRDNIRPACGPCNFGSTRTVGRWEDE